MKGEVVARFEPTTNMSEVEEFENNYYKIQQETGLMDNLMKML